MHTKDTTAWSAAQARGTALAALSVLGDERCWDVAATAGILATAVYALTLRDAIPVEQVSLGRLILAVDTEAGFTALAREQLTAAGHRLDVVDDQDPVSVRWAWLHRTWDPDAAPGNRWDGLTRGIARGLPDAAVHVCIGWAAAAVDTALLSERGGLPRRTTVQIHGGDHGGQRGRIESGAWRIDATGVAVQPGPPAAYIVGVGAGQDHRTARVFRDDFTVTP